MYSTSCSGLSARSSGTSSLPMKRRIECMSASRPTPSASRTAAAPHRSLSSSWRPSANVRAAAVGRPAVGDQDDRRWVGARQLLHLAHRAGQGDQGAAELGEPLRHRLEPLPVDVLDGRRLLDDPLRLVGERQHPDQQLGVRVGPGLVAQVRQHLGDRVVERLDPAAAQHRAGHVEHEDEVERLARQGSTQAVAHFHLASRCRSGLKLYPDTTSVRCLGNRIVMVAVNVASLEVGVLDGIGQRNRGRSRRAGARPGGLDDRPGRPGLRLRGASVRSASRSR